MTLASPRGGHLAARVGANSESSVDAVESTPVAACVTHPDSVPC